MTDFLLHRQRKPEIQKHHFLKIGTPCDVVVLDIPVADAQRMQDLHCFRKVILLHLSFNYLF